MTRYAGSFRMFSPNQAASGFVEHYGHDTKHHQPSTTGNASFQIQTSPVWDPMSFTQTPSSHFSPNTDHPVLLVGG